MSLHDREPRLESLEELRRQLRAAAEEHRVGPVRSFMGRVPSVALAVGLAAILISASFTPPGRAATAWVAGLAGIGDPPTLDYPDDKPGSVVIDAGTVADGTPYELVARVIDRPETPRLLCFGIDWPTHPGVDQDSACVKRRPGQYWYSSLERAVAPGAGGERPGILTLIVEDPSVADVRVTARGGDGSETELPSKLIAVDPGMLDRVGREGPLRILTAPLDAETAAAREDDPVAARCDPVFRAIAFDDSGRQVGTAPPDDPRCGRASGD